MTLPSKAIASLVLFAAFGASVPASADTVRDGSVVLLTSASQGGGDSVCQASPVNEKACTRAEQKYERTADRINRQFDKKQDDLQEKRDRKLENADSSDEKDEIRDEYKDDLADLKETRDQELEEAEAEL